MAEENKEPEKTTDDIGKKLDLADTWLTKFGIIVKKHWGKLLLLLVCYCVYWAFTQPAPTETIIVEPIEEVVAPAEKYVVREYDELQKSGETWVIEVWSDSTETVKSK